MSERDEWERAEREAAEPAVIAAINAETATKGAARILPTQALAMQVGHSRNAVNHAIWHLIGSGRVDLSYDRTLRVRTFTVAAAAGEGGSDG